MYSLLYYYAMKGAVIHKMRAMAVALHCIASPRRISCLTPEREVNGVAPVKFMAMYEDAAVIQSHRATSVMMPVLLESNRT